MMKAKNSNTTKIVRVSSCLRTRTVKKKDHRRMHVCQQRLQKSKSNVFKFTLLYLAFCVSVTTV